MIGPARIDAVSVSECLPRQGRIWLQSCSAQSATILAGLRVGGDQIAGLTFTGVFVPGLNRLREIVDQACSIETFFMSQDIQAARATVRFLPYNYAGILAHLRSIRIDAALFMVAPPDENGICNFGPVADFLTELWPSIPIRIAHINPMMPRVAGVSGIPFRELTHVIEAPQDLVTAHAGSDGSSDIMAHHAANCIPDGATVQAGLGRAPEAVVSALKDHRNIRIHSGLVGDSAVELIDSGAVAGPHSITAGVAIGTRRLYDAVNSETFDFRPVSHTHSLPILASISNLVTVNSATQVDLFGQAYAEALPGAFHSGPGGASDFAAGARAAGGKRILVLPSRTKHESRIVAPGDGNGPVSLSRLDTDLVVTEHGVADLRDKDHAQRTEALIAIADPDFREGLARSWASAPVIAQKHMVIPFT